MIDIYLITGYLGAGKTTLLKHILSSTGGDKTGILINEYGRPDVDGTELSELAEFSKTLTNGSIFCECLKGSFEGTMKSFPSLEIRRLFIEASGMADPFSMTDFIKTLPPEQQGIWNFRGSICVVDACNFPQLKEELMSPSNQIKKSNVVVLNKADMVSEAQLDIITEKIKGSCPGIKIIKTTYGKVEIKEIEEQLQGEVANVGESTNRCGSRPYSAVLNLIRPVDENTVREFISDISEKFIRTKGYFMSTDGQPRFESSVYDDIDIKPCKIIPGSAQLVLISMENENLSGFLAEKWSSHFKGLMMLEEC